MKICGEVFGYFPFGFPAGDFGYTAVVFPFKVGGTYVFLSLIHILYCYQNGLDQLLPENSEQELKKNSD